jgi:hypothetical protein
MMMRWLQGKGGSVPDLEIQNRGALGVDRINALAAGPAVVRLAIHDGGTVQIIVQLSIEESLTLLAQLLRVLSLLVGRRA